MNNLKSELVVHSPNVNSLMKISLGLIFFTILSTAFVYAENKPVDENNLTVNIVENAFLYNSAQYFDNSMISTHPGELFVVTNGDAVSHYFVSGVSNANHVGKINYDDFLLCEFDPNVTSTYSNQNDVTDCDFTKDDRIITGEIFPGESVSIFIDEVGTYRLIDPDYPWMELLFYSFPDSESSKNVNSGFAVDDNISEQTSTESPEVRPVNVIPTPLVQTISVDVNGIFNDVEYSVQGMTVTGIESDNESMSLIFFVDVTDLSGTLNVEFDRTFFDSVYDGVDDSFFILVDGDESAFEETETKDQSRTLSVTVPYGTEELEIIGSVFDSYVEEVIVEEVIVEEVIVEEVIVEEVIVNDVHGNECGPGTLLENNICILDQRCGPGTILEGDACVLDSTPVKSQSTGNFRELIVSVSTALGIAGIIGVILALIARANKNKN